MHGTSLNAMRRKAGRALYGKAGTGVSGPQAKNTSTLGKDSAVTEQGPAHPGPHFGPSEL